MRIVIVGAGIGGLALALFLHRRGLRPLLLERSPALEAAGAGVQLGPNATRLLADLGLDAALTAVSVAPEAALVQSGVVERVLYRVPLGELAVRRWGAPYLQLHRADLQAVLLEAVKARDAADLQLGVAATTLDGGGVSAGGERLEADVIVGADGVRSMMRNLVVATPPRLLGETAWRALIPIERTPAVARVWTWANRHLVAYPVSGGDRLNIVAVTRGAPGGGSWTEPGDLHELRRLFRRSTDYVRHKLEQVASVSRWALADLPPLPRWTDGRVVLLGDAAHAMAPYLAQGAAMAIEDAEALARHLACEALPIPARLAAYEAERKPRAERVQAASRRNGRIFHLPRPASTLAFAAARTLDGRDGAAARLDWLYDYRPPPVQ